MNALWLHTVTSVVLALVIVILVATHVISSDVATPLLVGLAGTLGGHSVAKAGYVNAK